MGNSADMTLDGTLCQGCGEYQGEAKGHPVTCSACLGRDVRPLLAVPVQSWAKDLKVNFPAQCSCGHIILEKYLMRVSDTHALPFDWCGFCRTRTNLELVEIPAGQR